MDDRAYHAIDDAYAAHFERLRHMLGNVHMVGNVVDNTNYFDLSNHVGEALLDASFKGAK